MAMATMTTMKLYARRSCQAIHFVKRAKPLENNGMKSEMREQEMDEQQQQQIKRLRMELYSHYKS